MESVNRLCSARRRLGPSPHVRWQRADPCHESCGEQPVLDKLAWNDSIHFRWKRFQPDLRGRGVVYTCKQYVNQPQRPSLETKLVRRPNKTVCKKREFESGRVSSPPFFIFEQGLGSPGETRGWPPTSCHGFRNSLLSFSKFDSNASCAI